MYPRLENFKFLNSYTVRVNLLEFLSLNEETEYF